MQYLQPKSKPKRSDYAQERMQMGTKWQKFRRAIIQRRGGECVKCGATPDGKELHLDHIIPIRDGGERWDTTNLQLLCRKCHSSKTMKEVMGVGCNQPAITPKSTSALFITEDLNQELPFL